MMPAMSAKPGTGSRKRVQGPSLVLRLVGSGRTVPVGKAPVTIGRHPTCEFSLPEDERLSRQHCVIEPGGVLAAVIRDLNSRNGTFVNGIRIDRTFLNAGDVVRAGRAEFVVEAAEGETAGETDAEEVDEGKPLKIARGTPEWRAAWQNVLRALPPRASEPDAFTILSSGGKTNDALEGKGEGPPALLLLLQIAAKARATDIHIEPKGASASVRMRVDGQMVPIGDMPERVGVLVVGMVKAACNMKAAAADQVQEGHFGSLIRPAEGRSRQVDYRVSMTPSVHGQKMVIRVLDIQTAPDTLLQLGLPGWMEERVRRICRQDQGLLLVCGPTGSGKTTTLYNALREVDREAKNVVTIEDPVEYRLEQTTQIPIDEQRGNTFGGLLRSVLRQDPDVILVGEIRDEETASTAMRAAMTGHVVFTTVHAKDTIAAVFRLLDLKVEPYLVASALDVVLAQRLVRVLCEHCKRGVPISPKVATRLGRFVEGRSELQAHVGCPKCLGTGYRGRRAIFELLDFTDELRDVILREPSIQAMKKLVEGGLFATLTQSGYKLVGEGVTALEEVDRVAGT
jgi:type II secretory ATPase GspE/PulE/Tfp pilus assembly ATPase PilB-like protein/pSer/pThr/pTyr-binding forkhead associated (FHA) protein